MKKICILSLLLSLVSFSKGYVETYGKFYVESNGNNKVDKAGVRFNLEQGKFKFKTNIGVDELYFKEIDRDVAHTEKRKLVDYPKYLDYYPELNGYMYNVKQNVAKASKASLEYAMIRDEKADVTLKVKAKSEDFGNIYREYIQLGADVAFKFKGGVKLGLDNKLNCYIEKEQRLRTQNKIYLDVNISNKANIKTSFGIDHFNEKAKKNYPEYDVTDWGSENNLYFTTGFDFNVKANENVNIDGKFATIKSYNTTLKPYEHLNYFGVGDYRKLYTEEETGYLCEAYHDEEHDELMPQNFHFNSVDLDNNRKPGSVFKSYLKVKYVNKDFKIKVMPFVNAIFKYVTYEKYNGVIYGFNTEISNKFLNKYLLGSKVRIVETLRNSYFFSKGNFLDLNVYSAYEGKINDKLTLIPKIRFEYLNRHLKHIGTIFYGDTKFYNEYFLNRLKGEVGLELKYNVTNNLMLNAEAIAGLKFAKGEYKFISSLKENILSDKAINEYLKLNFNMKYEWK